MIHPNNANNSHISSYISIRGFLKMKDPQVTMCFKNDFDDLGGTPMDWTVIYYILLLL